MIASGIYEGRQAPAPGRPEMLNYHRWMEHSERRVFQAARTELRRILREQGFELE
jgi:hypothetical protein